MCETSAMRKLHIVTSVCQPSSKRLVGCTLELANPMAASYRGLSQVPMTVRLYTSDYSDGSQKVTANIGNSRSSGSFAKWSKSLGSSADQFLPQLICCAAIFIKTKNPKQIYSNLYG